MKSLQKNNNNGIILNIANIPIHIKASVFMKGLTSIEKALLHPFVIDEPIVYESRKLFTVNIETIDEAFFIKDGRLNSPIINRILTHFPSGKNDIIKKNLQSSLRIFFSKNISQIEKLMGLLDENSGYASLLMSREPFLLLLFNQKAKDFHIFLNNKAPTSRTWTYRIDVLRLLFRAIFATEKNGILLHASSAEDRGSGYAFVGRSSSGKSTVVRISRFQRILSDDTAVIRKINNSYEVFPNPWWNTSIKTDIRYPNKPAPLKAVFFIRKADKTYMRKMSFKEAMAGLMYGDWPFQQFGCYDNKVGIIQFYSFSIGLIKAVPFYELKIKKTNRFKKEFQNLLG